MFLSTKHRFIVTPLILYFIIEQAEYGFYLTKEAVEADYSSIFAEQNPNALREGALGYIENGIVVFGPYFD